jgi:hypothetical protein
MEVRPVEAGDPGSLLAAVLEGMKAESNEARRLLGTPNPEDSALFVKFVVVEWIGRQHVPPTAAGPLI